jgi:excisionase family DNA binding protein
VPTVAQTLTIAEAAEALGVSESRVRQLIRRGTLRPAPGGGTARVSQKAVEALVAERRGRAAKDSSGTLESVLDRILVRRLRPLREEVVAARTGFEQQVILRGQAEIRAERAEDAAATLRLRVADLEAQVALLEQRHQGWFRRRKVTAQEA